MSDVARVDWITERSQCSSKEVCAKLKEQMQKDVDEMNGMSESNGGDYGYRVEDNASISAKFWVVQYYGDGRKVNSIQVSLEAGNLIEIHNSDDNKKDLAFVIGWDEDDCKCTAVMSNRSLEIWEISYRALYPLFFGEE